MIIRLVVDDPNKKPGQHNVLVYQVPENSRELELLTQLLDMHNIEWVVFESERKRKERT